MFARFELFINRQTISRGVFESHFKAKQVYRGDTCVSRQFGKGELDDLPDGYLFCFIPVYIPITKLFQQA